MRILFGFFMHGSFFAVLAKLGEFQAILECFFILAGVVINPLAIFTLKFNQIILRHTHLQWIIYK